jgi:hypothetical protein
MHEYIHTYKHIYVLIYVIQAAARMHWHELRKAVMIECKAQAEGVFDDSFGMNTQHSESESNRDSTSDMMSPGRDDSIDSNSGETDTIDIDAQSDLFRGMYDSNFIHEGDYCKFVREEDVVEYLRGILWVVEMYIKGECPDVGFTYTGRPCVAPVNILNLIAKVLKKNTLESEETGGQNWEEGHKMVVDDPEVLAGVLDEEKGILRGGKAHAELCSILRPPKSDIPHLSAAGTSVAVLPLVCGDYVPDEYK